MQMTILRPRRKIGDSGQSLVEAAIITPLLLLVTFAIIDFGVLFYVNLALESGVSQAVRYGITGDMVSGLSREESIKAAMRDATPTLTIDDDDFQFSHLEGTSWVGGFGDRGDISKLTVIYRHTPFVLKPLFSGGYIDLRVESAMKNEEWRE